MTYEEATEYLFTRTTSFEKQGAAGYKEGLQTTLALDEHFGHPHHKFKTIHVAGTNGKGSVSHTLAALLQGCGYTVGLYTSPHLIDFRERIRINGEMIPEDYVVSFIENEKDFFEPLAPSFFELTTAMAFKYFSEQDVDIAVIEVGLGGRLDCTNIITPILSVITNISLDHTQLLGASVEQIAMEKAGIMKPGVPCVIGEATEETRPVFDAVAKEKGTPLIYAEDEQLLASATPLPNGKGWEYETKLGLKFCGALAGNYQPKNTNTTLCATHKLMEMGYFCNIKLEENKEPIAEELNNAFQNVCEMTGLMGRWQTIRQHPTVVCDTGHNVAGWQYLSKQLSEVSCNHMHIVFGMVDDKDVYGVMSLLPKNATYYFTKAKSKRAFPETSLKVFGDQFGLQSECFPSVEAAYKKALASAAGDDFIFIGGSTYIVAEFMKSRV